MQFTSLIPFGIFHSNSNDLPFFCHIVTWNPSSFTWYDLLIPILKSHFRILDFCKQNFVPFRFRVMLWSTWSDFDFLSQGQSPSLEPLTLISVITSLSHLSPLRSLLPFTDTPPYNTRSRGSGQRNERFSRFKDIDSEEEPIDEEKVRSSQFMFHCTRESTRLTSLQINDPERFLPKFEIQSTNFVDQQHNHKSKTISISIWLKSYSFRGLLLYQLMFSTSSQHKREENNTENCFSFQRLKKMRWLLLLC